MENNSVFINNWRIEIALESYFEIHAQEIWERNWMNPERHTTLNMNNLKWMETILKTLRGQFKEDDQMDATEA